MRRVHYGEKELGEIIWSRVAAHIPQKAFDDEGNPWEIATKDPISGDFTLCRYDAGHYFGMFSLK